MDLFAAGIEHLHNLISPVDMHRIHVAIVQLEEVEDHPQHEHHRQGGADTNERIAGRGEGEISPPREVLKEDSQAAQPKRRGCVVN